MPARKHKRPRNTQLDCGQIAQWVWQQLRDNGGWITCEDLDGLFEAEWAKHFTAADKERMPSGRLRCLNSLDWGKAILTQKHVAVTNIYQRWRKTAKGKMVMAGRTKVFVLIALSDLHRELLSCDFATKKNRFTKACDKCGTWAPMAYEVCIKCRQPFPPKPDREPVELD